MNQVQQGHAWSCGWPAWQCIGTMTRGSVDPKFCHSCSPGFMYVVHDLGCREDQGHSNLPTWFRQVVILVKGAGRGRPAKHWSQALVICVQVSAALRSCVVGNIHGH